MKQSDFWCFLHNPKNIIEILHFFRQENTEKGNPLYGIEKRLYLGYNDNGYFYDKNNHLTYNERLPEAYNVRRP